MGWLLSREVVVALAILGAGVATAGQYLAGRQRISPGGAKALNRVGYALMFISMALFLAAGLRMHG